MISYVNVAEPMAVPMTMFIRLCEFEFSSLKMGKSCKYRASGQQHERERETHVLRTGESEDLHGESSDERGSEVDEMNLASFDVVTQGTEITNDDNQNEVRLTEPLTDHSRERVRKMSMTHQQKTKQCNWYAEGCRASARSREGRG